MPVKNAYDEVIAVAQVINKNPDIDNGQFTEKDEKVTPCFTNKDIAYRMCAKAHSQKKKMKIAGLFTWKRIEQKWGRVSHIRDLFSVCILLTSFRYMGNAVA
jgi:hypothetical protein